MTIKRILAVAAAALTLCGTAIGQYATLTGSLSSSNGMPASNYIISFQPSQMGFIAGTGVVVNVGTYCATSTDGSVVGVPNPLAAPAVTTGFTGTLPPNNYFVKIAFYDASGNVTLVSPERQIQLISTGRLIVASPVGGLPSGAVGMRVYVSLSTNTETLQGSSTGSASYIQSVPLVSGAAVPSSNTTLCKQIANDAIWPTGTGYTVALTDTSGNTIPGYPMMWQLMGPNTTINLSNGLPYYHGTVYFPTPILSSPLNHALQSISGPVSLSGYNLTNVGAIGFGTSLPAWPIDVENGSINASGGYLINGSGGTSGEGLCSNGTSFNAQCAFYSAANPPPSVTLYYQTVQASGTSLPQEPKVNFIPGNSQTFSCVDNPGATRTDCTVNPLPFINTFTPTIVAGSATGGGTCTITGDDFSANITCSMPTPTTGPVWTVTYGKSGGYSPVSRCAAQPTDSMTSTHGVIAYYTFNTTTWVFTATSAASSAGTYNYSVVCNQ